MKKLLIISTLFLGCSLYSNELKWVDEQIEAIKPPRTGMDTSILSNIKDPFLFLIKEEKREPSPTDSLVTIPIESVKKAPQRLTLSLILNNSALINDTWYKKGDRVNGYQLAQITPKSVLLTKKNKQLLLSTKSSNKNINFKNK